MADNAAMFRAIAWIVADVFIVVMLFKILAIKREIEDSRRPRRPPPGDDAPRCACGLRPGQPGHDYAHEHWLATGGRVLP